MLAYQYYLTVSVIPYCISNTLGCISNPLGTFQALQVCGRIQESVQELDVYGHYMFRVGVIVNLFKKKSK
jgi:hypothetical protein